MLHFFISSTLILFSHVAHSSPKAAQKEAFHVAVKFDRSFYELGSDDKVLSYRQSGNDVWIKIQKCNQATVKKITDRYQTLWAEHQKQSGRPPTDYDVEVLTAGQTTRVARGSRFGNWLRALPKKIMAYDLEAQVACKR